MIVTEPYDPTILDIAGSLADAAWLRSGGVTNIPERIEALVADHDRLTAANEALATALHSYQHPFQVAGCARCNDRESASDVPNDTRGPTIPDRR